MRDLANVEEPSSSARSQWFSDEQVSRKPLGPVASSVLAKVPCSPTLQAKVLLLENVLVSWGTKGHVAEFAAVTR